MSEPTPLPPASNRREFLSGRALLGQLEAGGAALLDAAREDHAAIPEAGATVGLCQRAMACDFEILMNPGPVTRLEVASQALNLIEELEGILSVYRDETEISRLNQQAGRDFLPLSQPCYQILELSRRLSVDTKGAFDPTSGPVIALWRRCKAENRVPEAQELSEALSLTGIEHLELSADSHNARLARPGMQINLGAIGKGFALDRAAEILNAAGLEAYFLHGGRSSVLARGEHNGWPGWPVGVANPLFPERFLATVLVNGRGLSTSGSNLQAFRVGGERFGHVLDPRSGWPVKSLASVVVLADSAAEADALSTAFFVLGVEKTREYCHNHRNVSAILVEAPKSGQRLRVRTCNLSPEQVFWQEDGFEIVNVS